MNYEEMGRAIEQFMDEHNADRAHFRKGGKWGDGRWAISLYPTSEEFESRLNSMGEVQRRALGVTEKKWGAWVTPAELRERACAKGSGSTFGEAIGNIVEESW